MDKEGEILWGLPVVGETYDGFLNEISAHYITDIHLFDSIKMATSGLFEEGNVGGGTGMICHQFKGGIGTSSRCVSIINRNFTIGVLVQANYGYRHRLTISGVPVGHFLTEQKPVIGSSDLTEDTGSIIVIVATDAPLLPHQLKKLARRVPFGIARVGGTSGDSSGDIYLAFSTANPNIHGKSAKVEMLANNVLNDLYEGLIQATEEAIVNALCKAETMTGRDGNLVYELPYAEILDLLRKYKRIE